MIDTDVLIWYFRGNDGARKFLQAIPYQDRTTSSLCLMELIQGCQDRQEMRAINDFFSGNISLTIHPSEKISDKAIFLLERHALADGLRTVDALIAASALQHGYSLATANVKHFKKIPDLSILRFEP